LLRPFIGPRIALFDLIHEAAGGRDTGPYRAACTDQQGALFVVFARLDQIVQASFSFHWVLGKD